MKTHVIRLERHDDLLSARDQIAWSKSTRVLFVMPEKGGNLFKKLDLVFLQRYATSLGAQIALVSKNEELIVDAEDLGIPVFETEMAAQRSPWRRNLLKLRGMKPRKVDSGLSLSARECIEKDRTPSGQSQFRILFFLIGISAVILLVLFFLPTANISIQLVEQEQTLKIGVWANPSILTPNVSGGLPAKEISVIVEGQNQIASTGKLSLPSEPAKGEVTLRNITDQEVYVPAGTVLMALSTQPIRFKTLNTVTLPAGLDQSLNVPIEAVLPGVQGNLPEGEIRAVEGAIGLKLTVENQLPTQGGVNLESPSPTELDYEKLKESILSDLSQAAVQEIIGQLDNEHAYLSSTIQLNKILEEKREPAVDLPGDHLNINIRAEYTALFYDKGDEKKVAQAAMDAALAPGFVAIPDTLLVTEVGVPQFEGQNTRWEIYSVRKTRADWSYESLVPIILGTGVDRASLIIRENIHLAAEPVIQITPSFWKRLPYLPFRIRVNVK